MNKRIYLKSILAGVVILVFIGLLIPISNPLFTQPYATVLESSEGQLLGARIADDGQWRFPASDSLPENYIRCLLQFEDRHFYYHIGINPFSIIRAIHQNIKAHRIVSGGSTITMQIARMAMGNKPRTISQKLIELWLALRIELKYSKKEILLLYANNAPFGGNVVGISAAAWRYYGRSPHHLSWAEAANLAVLPNAPGLIFPGKNDKTLFEKRNRLLSALVNEAFIDGTTYRLSLDEPLPNKPQPLPNSALHLLDRCIKDGLDQTTIQSTLNKGVQNTVNELVKAHNLIYKFKQIHNAAAIVANIKSGEVIAYVGNVASDGNINHGQQVDIINSRRSPGSILKPILYALAIDHQLITPYELLPDIPVFYQGFAPQNFDKQFKGTVPANLALRSSLNVPFVSLLRDYGYEKFHYDLTHLGVKSLDKPASHYGLSIILGGGEVTLWEMAGLYAGTARNLQTFNKNKGEKRYQSDDFRELSYNTRKETSGERTEEESRISAAATWHMLNAMQELRRPDAESNWQLFNNSRSIAWKTGTSYGHKDAWAIGLNSDHVVGVWLGNADGEGRSDLTGVSAAAPLMFRIFETIDGEAIFPMPLADIAMMHICKQSGRRASEICPDVEIKPIAKSAATTANCSYHQLIHLDESNSFKVNSKCYPVQKMNTVPWFVLPPAQAWYYKKFNTNYSEPPGYLNGCIAEAEGAMEMIYPKKFTKVFVPIEIDGQQGKVVFEAAHRNTEASVYWFLDDQYVGETREVHQMGLSPSEGHHRIFLVDHQGRELSVAFDAVNKRKL